MNFLKKHFTLIFSLVLIAASFSVTLYNIYHSGSDEQYRDTYDITDDIALATYTPAPTAEPTPEPQETTDEPDVTIDVAVDLADFFKPEGLFLTLKMTYNISGQEEITGMKFVSSDETVVQVDDAFAVKTLAPGTATVSAVSNQDGSVLNSVEITVYPFQVQTNEDGTYRITYFEATGPDLVIPESINEIPITKLDRGCLQYHTELVSVQVPETVTEFAYYVFQGCSNLMKVNLPGGLKSIGNCCFYGCSKLTELTVPDSVGTVGQMAFQDCYSLQSVSIGSGCYSLGANAFDGCTALKTISIGSSLGADKFIDIFKSAYMSPAVSLLEVNISAWNPSLKSVDGVVYNKAGSVLIFYPFGRTASELWVPSGVVRIDPFAVTDNKYLQKLVLPSSCTKLDDHSVFACDNLVTVELPGVTSIGVGVLSGCKNLRNVSLPRGLTSVGELSFQKDPGQTKISVTYGGSESEWQRIEFGADTTWLTGADITYLGGMNTPVPTAKPTAKPTATPTATPAPTEEPTEEPTEGPTEEPTVEPSAEPTEEPTGEPIEEPTAPPTETATPDPGSGE